jgi:hypothetical protein
VRCGARRARKRRCARSGAQQRAARLRLGGRELGDGGEGLGTWRRSGGTAARRQLNAQRQPLQQRRQPHAGAHRHALEGAARARRVTREA